MSVQRTLEQRIRRMTPVGASPDEKSSIDQLSAALHGVIRAKKRRAGKCLLVTSEGDKLPIPATLFYLLEQTASLLSRGMLVAIMPEGSKITTQQAADLLNMSRQYVVRLCSDGKIPFEWVGRHRRLKVEDVIVFKERWDRDQWRHHRRLVRLAQAEGDYE